MGVRSEDEEARANKKCKIERESESERDRRRRRESSREIILGKESKRENVNIYPDHILSEPATPRFARVDVRVDV